MILYKSGLKPVGSDAPCLHQGYNRYYWSLTLAKGQLSYGEYLVNPDGKERYTPYESWWAGLNFSHFWAFGHSCMQYDGFWHVWSVGPFKYGWYDSRGEETE